MSKTFHYLYLSRSINLAEPLIVGVGRGPPAKDYEILTKQGAEA